MTTGSWLRKLFRPKAPAVAAPRPFRRPPCVELLEDRMVPSVTPIHDIQGNEASSPIAGQSVTTSGIVTAVKSNGFFLQAPDADVDADPATSEGIFVFTSSSPPTDAVVGNQVTVTGTVTEFVPSADPFG